MDAEGELPVLRQAGVDLHIHMRDGFKPIKQVYYLGAIYISLLSLLLGRRPPV